jgi:hypothetical protein
MAKLILSALLRPRREGVEAKIAEFPDIKVPAWSIGVALARLREAIWSRLRWTKIETSCAGEPSRQCLKNRRTKRSLCQSRSRSQPRLGRFRLGRSQCRRMSQRLMGERSSPFAPTMSVARKPGSISMPSCAMRSKQFTATGNEFGTAARPSPLARQPRPKQRFGAV